jgi:endonuclease/exonuclease/phosphatase family metal-dependent hydrolase
MSFNMQVGIGTKRQREYFTRGWRHLLPCQDVHDNLNRIAELLNGHDIIGLQEVDAGSQRSHYENQTERLASQAGFPFWHVQVNRDLGRVAQHGLGLISRYPPFSVTEHKLPGRLPGRGALIARFGTPAQTLAVVITHLSLGARDRAQQFAAICDMIANENHLIVMGDTNCSAAALLADPDLSASGLQIYRQPLPTYPSWRPRRGIDHIMASNNLTMQHADVVDAVLSDHRPVTMRIGIPDLLGQALAGMEPAARAAPPASTGRGDTGILGK